MKYPTDKAHERAKRLGSDLAKQRQVCDRLIAAVKQRDEVIATLRSEAKRLKGLLSRQAGRWAERELEARYA